MSVRRIALLVALTTACRDKPAPPPADTPAVVEQAQEQPAPAAPATRIGTLPLLDRLSPVHRCSSQNFEGLTAIVQELRYEGDVPPRVIVVSLAAPERGFRIVNVDVSSRRETSPGQEESERLFVIFSPTGDVQSGTREYASMAEPEANAKAGLLPDDSAAVKQLAQDVVDQCGGGA